MILQKIKWIKKLKKIHNLALKALKRETRMERMIESEEKRRYEKEDRLLKATIFKEKKKKRLFSKSTQSKRLRR